MAYDYGMPDSASVLGQTPSYGAAAASLMPAPTGTSDPNAFVPNKWKASWRNVNGVSDFYYEKSPGDWQPIPDDVRQSNSSQFGTGRVAALREAERQRQGKAELAQVNENAAAQYRAELDLKTKGLEAQITGLQNSYTLGLEGLRQSGENTRATIKAQGDNLAAQLADRGKDRQQAADQFDATMQQQNQLIAANNQIQNRRLDIEDRHFQQQVALDERNARRTKVLGSLTLIAQSLQRL